MNMDGSSESIEVISIDLSEGFDTQSKIEILLKRLRSLPFYRSDLLYSGFNGAGNHASRCLSKETVYCSGERDMVNEFAHGSDAPAQSALLFALENRKPAIALYDPDHMQPLARDYEYRVKTHEAVLAILLLTGI